MPDHPIIRDPGRHRALVLAVLGAVILALPGATQAGDSFTSPLIIPAAEFEASGVWSLGTLDRYSNSYGSVSSTSDQLTCVMAPVHLPNNVTITKFEAAVSDLIVADPGSALTCPHFYPDVEVDLISTHYDDNIYPQDSHVVTHASVSSQLDNGQVHIVADTSIVDPWVNNIQQVFWVRVYVCGQFEAFQGVRIHYEE